MSIDSKSVTLPTSGSVAGKPSFDGVLKNRGVIDEQGVIDEYLALAMDKHNRVPGSYEALAELTSFMTPQEVEKARSIFFSRLKASPKA